MADEEIRIRIWRGDARGGGLRDYRLRPEEGMVVLDAVRAVQAREAPDLAVRWNCKAGRCGSCSAEINGMPRLMCMTRMDSLPAHQPISVAPLHAFPVIRDLVTDVSVNYEKSARLAPFDAGEPPPEGLRMYQVDVDRIREFHNCIECFLCQDVCHVLRDHDEHHARYAGPRVFVRAASLEMHPADRADRMPYLKAEAAIEKCNVTKCCTEVCPENIRITDNAIIPLRERLADRYYDPVARLLGLFSHR
jgi:succinate dehydrogenase / fumarate reductase iron-sulfur subunit